MDTAHPQNFSFILDRNLVKASCTGNQICTPCDMVLRGDIIIDIVILKDIIVGSLWPPTTVPGEVYCFPSLALLPLFC